MTRDENERGIPYGVGWHCGFGLCDRSLGGPYGATCSRPPDQAASRLAPTGFDQAQGGQLTGEGLRLYEIDCANREPWTDCALKLTEECDA